MGIAARGAGGSIASSSCTDTARKPRSRIARRIFGSARSVQGWRSCRRMIDPGRSPRSTFRTIAPTRGVRDVVASRRRSRTPRRARASTDLVRRPRMLGIRGAEEPRLPADLRIDLVLRPHQLEPDEPVRQARQVRMRPGVVADAAEPRLRVRSIAASTRAGCRRRRTSHARRFAAGSARMRLVYGLGPSSNVSATASP